MQPFQQEIIVSENMLTKSGEHKNYHPLHSVNDGKFNTYSGKILDLINPTPEMICIEDINVGLSNVCRFGGQTNQLYTVSQHSVILMLMVPAAMRKEALLHDASEAYLGDVHKPLKVMLGASYASIENRIQGVINQKYDLDSLKLEKLKPFEDKLVEVEHELLQKNNDFPWINLLSDMGLSTTDVWNSSLAYLMFKNYAENVNRLSHF